MLIVRRILLTIILLLALVYAGLVAYAYWPYPEGLPAKQLAGKDDQFIDVDGMQIRYRAWGEPAAGKPAIVLIHGFANSVTTFRRVAPLMGQDYYVIALDMPGFGLSAKPDDRDYSNPSQAAAVVDFIRELGLDNVVIGGHSMGGALALHVALAMPEVTGILLFNPGIITTGVPAATEYFTFPLPRLAAKTFADRTFRERFIKTSFVDPSIITDDVMDELMLAANTDDYITGTTQLMSYYVAGDEISMLNDIRVPVLIVWGVQDSNKPEGEDDELVSMLETSRLVRIPSAGHYVHEEAPAEAAAAVREATGFWAQPR